MIFSLGDEGVDTVEEALSRIPLLIDSYRLSSAEVILEVRTNKISLRDRNSQVRIQGRIERLHVLLLKQMD